MRRPKPPGPVLLLALAGACSPGGGAPAPAESPPEAADDSGPANRIGVPPEVRRNLGIEFAPVQARRVAETLRVPGAFEPEPLARREYRMSLPGHVELLVDELERVEAGEPLFRFLSPRWPELVHEIVVGEQALASGEAGVEVARAKLAEGRRRLEVTEGRLAALRTAGTRSAELEATRAGIEAGLPRLEAELALARTELENARATFEHALHRAATSAGFTEAELLAETAVDGETVPFYRAVGWIEVRAAEAGVVESLGLTQGAFAEPPAVVLTTIAPERLRFRALALQADLQELADVAAARIVPPLDAGAIEGVPARVRLGLDAHPTERMLTVFATPESVAGWMRPGVSAFLEVEVAATAGPRLAVPRSAVVQDGLHHVIFRRDPSDPNRVIRVEADLGVDDGRWVVIESGLGPGDEVVVAGAYELKLASGADERPEGGHFHADGSFHGEEH